MRLPSAIFAGWAVVALAAPASALPSDINAGYYRKYSCTQLLDEGRQVSARAATVAHDLADASAGDMASEDAVIVPGVLAGTKPMPGELGILKQKLSAIQDATIQSQCQIEFRGSGH